MRISDWSSDVCSSDLVDEAVALDARVRDLMVAVDHRIGHAVHHRDRALERAAREPLEIIVANGLVTVDDAHAAGVGHALAEEDVALDEVTVAVAEHEGALGSAEGSVGKEGVSTGRPWGWRYT